MRLSVDGIWKGGLWASTVWANDVWYEPSAGSPSVAEDEYGIGFGFFSFI